MQLQKLQEIGLSLGESKVYLALLELGVSTKSAIVTKSKVSSSKVYEILDRLISKGLVSTFLKNKVKHYVSAHPEKLLEYSNRKQAELHRERKQIESLIPILNQSLQSVQRKSSSVVYEGIEGVQTAMQELFTQNSGKIYRAMGVTSTRNPIFNRTWFHWHTKRVSKRIRARLIFSEAQTEYYQQLSHMRLTEIRHVKTLTPATFGILGDKVIIVDYTKHPVCVIITNPHIALSFQIFFDSLWELSKENNRKIIQKIQKTQAKKKKEKISV
jgi:HTH-type transcriptional regulator, sugar sensing transcriptional regulator